MLKKLWQNYNLSIVLLILFLTSWVIQTIAGWYEFTSEQKALGETVYTFGADGYVARWAEATFENWQSEFLQLFSMVVLTSFLIHKGSAESRDSQDEMMAKLEHIEQELESLKKQKGSGS
jgi:hypothetical protein